jgi:ribose transport system ATP-binding protein
MIDQSPILKLKNICKSFSGIQVLKNVDLELYPGEVHCLMGENGAGKSTLIKIISGSYIADSGEIHYMEQTYPSYTPRWAHQNGINTIYQEIDLVPHLTVAENIYLGNEPLTKFNNINKSKMIKDAEAVFKDMGIDMDVHAKLQTLKVANQQLVAIAKAIAFNSKVMILDEPTAVFTNTEVELLFKLIRKLKEQKIALLYISHHIEEIFEIGDRITVLRDGALVQSGLISEFNKDSLIKSMVGRDVKFERQGKAQDVGDEILSVENLGLEGVVENITFKLHRGEILGIGGLVGAGRTEMARLLMGADSKQSGKIIYMGKETDIKSPNHALSLGIGLVPEDRKQEGIVPMRAVSENMAYSLIEKKAKFGIVPWKSIRNTVTENFVNLNVQPQIPSKNINLLSGGNQQKAVLGKMLCADCDVLILDEPTRGVDVGAREEIYKVMKGLKEKGLAILMISSDLIELMSQSDRILVMAGGKIAGEFSSIDAKEEDILALALNQGGNQHEN